MNRQRGIPAIAIIAKSRLRNVCVYRIYPHMTTVADQIIDALGGTTAVGRMTKAPPSTVHSWRKNGIPASRMDHLRLAAKEAGVEMPAFGEQVSA